MPARMLALAATVLAVVSFAPGAGAAAGKNAVRLDLPTTVKVGQTFIMHMQVAFNPRDHDPAGNLYLEAGWWVKRGTDRCPETRLPRKRDGWEEGLTLRYQPGEEFPDAAQSPSLERAGRHRFCAYVYVKRYSGRKVVSVSVKARDAELVRATR
ncbi:MAG: hypothetical protein ACEQSX_08400 [Baekduiaceae bacterium]